LIRRHYIFLLLLLFPLQVSSQNIDIRLLRFFNSPESLPSDNFFRFVSNSDAYVVTGIPAGLAVTGLVIRNQKLVRNALTYLGASAITFGITTALKYSINRPRPFITYPDIIKKSDAGSPSFPSGHTSSAFAMATSLSLAYPEWYIMVPSFAYACTVAYSSMYLGVHYPSDVAAGALIGAGCAYLSYKVNKALLKKHNFKPCDCPEL
jgi:membrane-associated phospholipid phosphatase